MSEDSDRNRSTDELPPREKASSEPEVQPRYERKAFYPAAHTVMRLIRRHRDDFKPSSEATSRLSQDQVDAMMLDIMALADEYLTRPMNVTATEQQRRRISEFALFDRKEGSKLVDAFLDALKLEQSWRVAEQSVPTTISHDIEQRLVDVLSSKQVRDEFERLFSKETTVRRKTKKKISHLLWLEHAIDTARSRYREMQNEPRTVDPKSAPIPTGLIERSLGQYLNIVTGLTARLAAEESRLSYRELGLLESSRLLRTRHQMKEFGFALTESRQALFDRISELSSSGYKIFLGGPTGTGKTSLAIFAMRQILGREHEFEVVSWSSETTVRDLFGKPIIKSTPGGSIESTMQKGPYARVLAGEIQAVVNDEYTTGPTAAQLSLKRIYQARPGERITLPGFNGQVFTKENYMEISTGNLRSRQHAQREELDPAIVREFVSIAVPFMNAQEAKQVLLSSFIHETGFLPISERDVEMIDQLCRAAEFTQKAFEGKFTEEERKSDLYRQIEPTGAEVHLTKTFLDSGTLFRLLRGVSGRSFDEHLRVNLQREINENPHLEILAHEQQAFKKILRAFGFDVDATTTTDFYHPVAKTVRAVSSRPYVLPSQMGFLSSIKKSDVDEFADQEAVDREAIRTWAQQLRQELVDGSVAGITSTFRSVGIELGAPLPAEVASDQAMIEEVTRAIGNLLQGVETLSPQELLRKQRQIQDLLENRRSSEGVTLAEAERILGKKHVLGPDDWKETFDVQIGTVPPIPFTAAELKRAQARGDRLVLDVGTLPNGRKLTMKQLHENVTNNAAGAVKWYNPQTHGKLLNNPEAQYKDEPFFTSDVPQTGWRLTSAGLLDNSRSKNYAEQTQLLIEGIRERQLVSAETEASYRREFSDWLDANTLRDDQGNPDWQKIKQYCDADATWKKAAEELAAMQVNQDHRTKPVQDFAEATMLLRRGTRLYDGQYRYNWTGQRASDGYLVYVGYFDAVGAVVDWGGPGFAGGSLGVRLSLQSPSS